MWENACFTCTGSQLLNWLHAPGQASGIMAEIALGTAGAQRVPRYDTPIQYFIQNYGVLLRVILAIGICPDFEVFVRNR